ncbi:MFS transporter [Oxalobacteraceae bacterium]|nr:MFS transporter [Oxalobacteraceae bacterium]
MSKDEARAMRWATQAVFFANGLGIGAWASAIPPLKQGLALTDGQLSMALLAMAAGAVCCMPLCGRLVPRLGGTGAATRLAAIAFALMLCLPMWASSLPLLIASTLLLGAANGVLDVAMNAHASAVERRWGEAIMSSFHAAFSLGGLVGTGVGAALLYLGLPSSWMLVPATLIVLALLGFAIPRLGVGDGARTAQATPHLASTADAGAHSGKPAQASAETHAAAAAPTAPRKHLAPSLFGLAAIGLLCFMVEGAMVDWSGLYLTTTGASATTAAAGFAAFSAAMVVFRVLGDRIVRRFGGSSVIVAGTVLAAAGLTLAAALPLTPAILAGYALAGVGLSNVVPAIFSAAGRQSHSAASGIALVASAGYAGLLLGPPLIGAIAHGWTLRAGVGVMAAGALCAAVLTLFVRAGRADRADKADSHADSGRIQPARKSS